MSSLNASTALDPRFELINSFKVTVPSHYVHTTQLDSFRATHQSKANKEFFFYNGDLSDKNFAKTPVLVPDTQFLVKAFQIVGTVVSKDCFDHLRSLKATLTGAQGISLAYDQKKGELPVSRSSLSFDEVGNLLIVGGLHRVPCIIRDPGDIFQFHLSCLEGIWHDIYVLLAFCEMQG